MPSPKKPTPPRVVQRRTDKLIPYARNARTHSDEQIAAIAASIREFGFNVPVLIDAKGGIIAGHGRVEAAKLLDLKTVPTISVTHLTKTQKRAFILADNKLTERGGWDNEVLARELADLKAAEFDFEATGFRDFEIEEIAGRPEEVVTKEEEPTPDVPKRAQTNKGDIWTLGEHVVACIDSTDEKKVKAAYEVANIERPDIMLTDPPYCSGGFQEAGRGIGSIGSKNAKEIANDRLTTRGYLSLVGSVVRNANAAAMYLFTDWKQWANLYDLSEKLGYVVRSMIVWDKMQPGMGHGWRCQHELILCGVKDKRRFDLKQSTGNVIKCSRTGNPNHPTQKPVELLATILGVESTAKTVVDPFAGSGSTLLACIEKERKFVGMELSPGYCDVILERFHIATGETPTRQNGNPFKPGIDIKLEKK